MPANAVKSSEEYLWRRAKIQAKAAGHENDWDYIMTIFQRMKKSMVKSFNITVGLGPLAQQRIDEPGQVPTRAKLKEMERLTSMPKPLTTAQLTSYDEPVLSVNAIVKGLGLDAGQVNDWVTYLTPLTEGAVNEVTLSQAVMVKAQGDNLDRELTRAILQRTRTYYRHVHKSLVEIVNVNDELVKADPRGGSYYRRTPNASGKGYRYFYDKEDYDKHAGAHTKGEDAQAKYIANQVAKCLGDDGCEPAALKALVKKYGSKAVAQGLKGQAVLKKGKLVPVNGK